MLSFWILRVLPFERKREFIGVWEDACCVRVIYDVSMVANLAISLADSLCFPVILVLLQHWNEEWRSVYLKLLQHIPISLKSIWQTVEKSAKFALSGWYSQNLYISLWIRRSDGSVWRTNRPNCLPASEPAAVDLWLQNNSGPSTNHCSRK